MDKLLLNGKPFRLRKMELPCLIHGQNGSGASYMSVLFMARLAMQGKKILFFSARAAARELFTDLLHGHEEDIKVISSSSDLEFYGNKKMIIPESGNAHLFRETVRALPDLNERIIFIKNIEEYNLQIFDTVRTMQNVIYSGDIDRCTYSFHILSTKLSSYILFSPSTKIKGIHVPTLKRYQGFFWSPKREGLLQATV